MSSAAGEMFAVTGDLRGTMVRAAFAADSAELQRLCSGASVRVLELRLDRTSALHLRLAGGGWAAELAPSGLPQFERPGGLSPTVCHCGPVEVEVGPFGLRLLHAHSAGPVRVPLYGCALQELDCWEPTDDGAGLAVLCRGDPAQSVLLAAGVGGGRRVARALRRLVGQQVTVLPRQGQSAPPHQEQTF